MDLRLTLVPLPPSMSTEDAGLHAFPLPSDKAAVVYSNLVVTKTPTLESVLA